MAEAINIVSAIKSGDLDFFRRFVKANPSTLDKAHAPDDWTLLHYLASLGNETRPVHSIMADELVRSGADLNCRTPLGWTPIHMIAMQGQKEAAELARLLVARGADLRAVDKFGSDWKLHWQHGEEIRHVLETAQAPESDRLIKSTQATFAAGITRTIRWIGYFLIGIGILLFAGTYIATYVRGGISDVLARFFNLFHDIFLVVLCLGPGLLLLGWA